MKLNHPVTDREVSMKESTILVTKTDIQGKITHANDDFIEISGFTAEELIGANHNIVRHPDMPAAAFADLWSTVKRGRPWRGIVKNRTKSGDYYWVEANVTPLFKNGQIDEFLSVRYSPSREQIRSAEDLYEKLRRNQASIRPQGLLTKMDFISKLSIKGKLIFSSLFFLLPALLSTTLLVRDKNVLIDFSAQEVIGAEYHQALTGFLSHVMDYNGLSVLNANAGHAADSASLEQTGKALEADLLAVDASDNRYGETLKTSETWRSIKLNWSTLSAETPKLSAEDAYAKQSLFIESLYAFIADLNDNSNLMLDPDLDSFWLMDMTAVKLPELMERLAFLRGYIALVYTGKPIEDKQKIDLMVKYRLAQRLFDKVMESAVKTSKFNESVAAALSTERAHFESTVKQYLTDVRVNLIENNNSSLSADQYFNAGSEAIRAANGFYGVGLLNLKQLLTKRIDNFNHDKITQVTAVAVFTFIALIIGFFIIRYISLSLGKVNNIFFKLTNGEFKNHIDLDSPDEFGEMLRGLQGLQVKLFFDLSDIKNQAKKTLIIKNALDNVQSCVMVANTDRNIIYMNNTVLEMFRDAQADIRSQLPAFDADKLMGANIDQFHKQPAHQSELLAMLPSTFSSSLVIGSRHMNIVANPVRNENGEHIGTVVEWLDRTREVKIEKDIEDIVAAVKAGELSRRIEMADKHGFFEKLSVGINELSDVIESAFMDIGGAMRTMAEGDLTHRISRDYQGAYLNCKNDINATLDKLNGLFGQISEKAHFIDNSSQEISIGNNNLSQRAEKQAASLEETAASMEQLTSTVKNNAHNAQQANQVANQAGEFAENGGKVVKSAVLAMQEINESSNRISDIIGVIDEIAFQTNLLALNASVEAARAGEQGRGFSVVATEVRNLAQRSATAAKESKELIQNSVRKVRVGAEYVNETGKALSDIVAGVKKVGDIVAEIAAASVQQSAGIGQVNQAVAQMEEITQQNASLAEEVSATSIAMSDMSTDMVKLLSFFRTDNQTSNTHPGPSANRTPAAGNDKLVRQADDKPYARPGRQAEMPKRSDDEWQDF